MHRPHLAMVALLLLPSTTGCVSVAAGSPDASARPSSDRTAPLAPLPAAQTARQHGHTPISPTSAAPDGHRARRAERSGGPPASVARLPGRTGGPAAGRRPDAAAPPNEAGSSRQTSPAAPRRPSGLARLRTACDVGGDRLTGRAREACRFVQNAP